jgi:hypothetical protein
MIAHVDNPNLAILEMAVQTLGELTDSLVFAAIHPKLREVIVRRAGGYRSRQFPMQ